MNGDPPHLLFRTLAAGDVAAILDVAHYGIVETELSRLVRSGRARQWDPATLGIEASAAPLGLMPESWFPEGRTACISALAPDERARLGDEILRWLLSGILHGEQAALTVCSQLCARFAHPTARAFAAGQAEEEARHVEAFTRYIAARWGEPYPAGEAFGAFLAELIASESAAEKLVGICLLVEGFAMGAFANIHAHTRDPALKSLLVHVMRDEAIHHQFGLMWSETVPAALPATEREAVARTVLRGFRALTLNLVSVRQRRRVFARFGLDWRHVRAEVRAGRADPGAARGLEENINPLAVLARTLLRAGWLPSAEARALEAFLARAGTA
jgi:hypothetical protein